MAARIRKNARSLPPWDPILLWYARAVREMQQRLIADPISWRYQAAVHDYIRSNDPYASGGDVLPNQSQQRRYWRQCQHFSWFFLPWHRMYLGHFEQMMLSIIADKGGPSDWALPYWNYSANDPDARRLPQAFVDPQMPEGTPNPLRLRIGGGDVVRDAGNAGELVGDENDVDLQSLTETEFQAAPFGGSPGFGGPKTRFKHARRPGEPPRFGSLEATPHGTMHNAVGGWMSGFETAALDPIFWLHHCNIDRLWEVWLRHPRQQPKEFTNPTAAGWRTAVKFQLHNAQGNPVTMTPSQVVDTETSIFEYKYDDVADPLPAAPTPVSGGMLRGMERQIPEMVGATEAITLTGEITATLLSTSEATGPASTTLAAGTPQRYILNVENVTAEGRSQGYAVYVNLPEGADPARHRELFAGNLPLFGIDAVENPGEPHAGEGLWYALDITRVVQVLQERGDWDPRNIRLSFVPKRRPGPTAVRSPSPPVHVGRVSLYLA
jgi:tyrosinase